MEYIQFIISVDSRGLKTTRSFPLETLTEILSTENSVTIFLKSVTASLPGEIDKNKSYYGTRITLNKSGEGNSISNGLFNLLYPAYLDNAEFPYVINLTQLVNDIDIEDIVGSSFPVGYYGSFYDTTNQLNAGPTAANAMTFNTTDSSNGVSVVSSSRLTIENTGIYNIQFSAQVTKTDSGDDDVDIWFSKNSVNIPNSNTIVFIPGNNARLVAAWNFIVQASAGDYFEIYWSSTDTDILLLYQGPTGPPSKPAIPSVIATVTWVGFAQ